MLRVTRTIEAGADWRRTLSKTTIGGLISLAAPTLAAVALSSCGSMTKFTDVWTASDVELF